MYLSAGKAVAHVTRVFPSAFFTLHPHQLDPWVVQPSVGLLLVEKKAHPLNKELPALTQQGCN